MISFEPLPKNIHEKIDSLAGLLMENENIIFAYLFGSLSKGGFHPLSDIDLALYIKRVKTLDYLKLFGEISETLGTDEIDLVILNNAPLSLAGRILQARKILTDKNSRIRHKYESMTLRKFFDFKVKEKNILQGRYGLG